MLEKMNEETTYFEISDCGNSIRIELLGLSHPNAEMDWDKNWVKAIEKDKLTWTHVSDLGGWGNAVGQLYGITSIPQNILVNKEGIIVAKNLRGEELLSKLAEIFGN